MVEWLYARCGHGAITEERKPKWRCTWFAEHAGWILILERG
jgi:hypothetical protein